MSPSPKEWLVRKQSREILGPFTQPELVAEFKRHTFGPEDEVSRSEGQWFPAQNLTHRDSEELTRTSTRNETLSLDEEVVAPERIKSSLTPVTAMEEEFTPTPESPPRRFEIISQKPSGPLTYGNHEDIYLPPNAPTMLSRNINRAGPITSFLLIVFGLWVIIYSIRSHKPQATENQEFLFPSPIEGESPFVRKMYQLIQIGLEQKALKELAAYHEKEAKKNEVEYLVPYAALLITLKESPPRAKKLLETVLSSDASPKLKSRAHHWLGFLLLSQDDGDLGENHFLESLQLNPKDAAARFNLGRCYLRQDKHSQALDYLQLAELEMPDLWLVHIYKGRAKAALGSTVEAKHSFESALKHSHDRWISYIYYALFLMSTGELEKAQSTLTTMLQRDPHFELNSPPPWGFFQERLNYSEYYNAFTEVMKKSSSPWKELGRNYIGYLVHGINGNEVKRLEALAEKGDIPARYIRLKLLLDRNAPSEELKLALSKLPEGNIDFGYYGLVLQAQTLNRMEQPEAAEKLLKQAAELEPGSAVVKWEYARLLGKTQREDLAKSELKKLLASHPNYVPAVDIFTSQTW